MKSSENKDKVMRGWGDRVAPTVNAINDLVFIQAVIANEVKQSQEIAASLRSPQRQLSFGVHHNQPALPISQSPYLPICLLLSMS
jgi:hypothetical protein